MRMSSVNQSIKLDKPRSPPTLTCYFVCLLLLLFLLLTLLQPSISNPMQMDLKVGW